VSWISSPLQRRGWVRRTKDTKKSNHEKTYLYFNYEPLSAEQLNSLKKMDSWSSKIFSPKKVGTNA
jgi:hypothetical protein